MAHEPNINQLLLILTDFVHSSHRMRSYILPYINTNPSLHEKIFSRLRQGTLTLKDIYDFNDEQYAILVRLIASYKSFFAQYHDRFSLLFSDSSVDVLAPPLTLEMSKGWPMHIIKDYPNIPKHLIRP